MKKTTTLLITIIFLMIIKPIIAQDKIPDNPVGKKLQLVLEAFQLDNVENFLIENFTTEFLNQFPMEMHLAFFKQVKLNHNGFTLHKIVENNDYMLEAVLKSNSQNSFRKILIAVEQNAPHKIYDFGIEMASLPDDVPYTGKIYEEVSKNYPDKNAVVQGEIAQKIDNLLKQLETQGFSGSILVAKKGKIILSKGYGFANREKKIPFHTSSAFDIGSITKQFTGAAILKLEMMGKLSTDDFITSYFKNVPTDKQKITIHQLLTHTAGFTDALGHDYITTPKSKFINLAFNSELENEPGTQYAYSNVGYSLLGIIIEKVTGNSYEKFLHDNLFIPAGMLHTGYKLGTWSENQIVVGYFGDEIFGQPHKKNWDNDGPWWHLRANGGIISTTSDMYRWHKALNGSLILSEDAKKKYYYPHVEEPGGGTFYGYGWVIAQSSRGTKVYMHNGGNQFFSNDCFRYVDDEVFVYISSSNGEISAPDQSGKILRMIFY